MDFNIKNFNARLRSIKLRELIIGTLITILVANIAAMLIPSVYYDDDLYFIALMSVALVLFIWALRGTTGLGENFSKMMKPKIGKEMLFVFVINMFFALLLGCLLSNIEIIISVADPTWISMLPTEGDAYELFIFEIIASVIFAPILEELIFRGVLFTRLKIRIGVIPAILLSSLLFAMGHELGGITSAFLFGVCMCILYLKTDNILITMTIHFANNLLVTLMTYMQMDYIFQMPWLVPTTILSLISTLLIIIYTISESLKLNKKYA